MWIFDDNNNNKKLALQPGNGKLLTQQNMKIVPTENWNEANN